MENLDLNINFDELDVEDVETFTVDGAKGLPEFAASCCCCRDSCCGCGSGGGTILIA